MREITNALGNFELASLELQQARRTAEIRHVEDRRIRDAIRLCDVVLAQLEHHNLSERPRVGSTLRPALQRLFETSPVPCPMLSTGSSVRRTIDTVLELQEELLALKGGAFRRRLRAADEPLDAA
jgi:hypothetical protein